MWTTMSILMVVLTFCRDTSADITFAGCFSTTIVRQYEYYYKMNTSLLLEESFAACNHRLTRYIGLEVDTSSPSYSHVYCGNDLAEVSVRLSNSSELCQACQENSSYNCGEAGVMAVYKLRDSTPLALILTTDQGVERLINNETNLIVVLPPVSDKFRFVDYIYTDDMILTMVYSYTYRLFYNVLTMRYTLDQLPSRSSKVRSMRLDFSTKEAYYVYWYNDDLYKVFTLNSTTLHLLYEANNPAHISIDPYNRSVVYTILPFQEVVLYDMVTPSRHTLLKGNYHIDKFHTLSMEIQDQLMYAIVSLTGDNTYYLVSLDHVTSKMRVLYSGDKLANATVVEGFQGQVVWLVGQTIYRCHLTPRCKAEHVTSYRHSQPIYDFVIYHPEKQTPGAKRLCRNMTCTHGCETYTPFSARCSCPPGMLRDSGNNTCYYQATTLETNQHEITTMAQSMEPTETISGSFTKASSSKATDYSGKVERFPEASTTVSTTRKKERLGDKTSSHYPTATSEMPSGKSFTELFSLLADVIQFILLTALIILVVIQYRRKFNITQVPEPRLELKEESNIYVEIPLQKR